MDLAIICQKVNTWNYTLARLEFRLFAMVVLRNTNFL